MLLKSLQLAYNENNESDSATNKIRLKIHDILDKGQNPRGNKASEVIRHSVLSEIAAYRSRQSGNPSHLWLDLPELRKMLEAGKVRFGALDHSPIEINEDFAVRAAHEAFVDQIILMFVDDQRITELDEVLVLTPASRVRYIKLNALRGC